ncbi:hypothetical protein STAS_14879 [Striga asiatica]|uniref:Uncharacterized protein n=1 Tax=Striga asiatica TaxID=4170 RepID=A0A5A7PZP4_STRAF|nr:hypothetical protein STAS_14879 [Striga asiatica]
MRVKQKYREYFKINIGDCASTHIWHDPWVPKLRVNNGLLRKRRESYLTVVKELIEDNGRSWNVIKSRIRLLTCTHPQNMARNPSLGVPLNNLSEFVILRIRPNCADWQRRVRRKVEARSLVTEASGLTSEVGIRRSDLRIVAASSASGFGSEDGSDDVVF